MKIGAYDLSSQMNMYTNLSTASSPVRKPDETNEIGSIDQVRKNVPVNDTLSLTGGDLFRNSPRTSYDYPKFNPMGVVQNRNVEKLDDFSLKTAKEDKINSRMPVADDNVNYKEIISDEEMDNFLRKAFKLFAAE